MIPLFWPPWFLDFQILSPRILGPRSLASLGLFGLLARYKVRQATAANQSFVKVPTMHIFSSEKTGADKRSATANTISTNSSDKNTTSKQHVTVRSFAKIRKPGHFGWKWILLIYFSNASRSNYCLSDLIIV